MCGVTIGLYDFIGAGAVVRSDVPDYAMMLGVPEVQRGWMSSHGHTLHFNDIGGAICPESKLRHQLDNNKVRCINLGETEPLPEEVAVGKTTYSNINRKQN